MQAEIAADYARGKQGTWHEKPDGSVVTDADIAANKIICDQLAKHFAGVAVLSEENPDADNQRALKAKIRFETDPLDNPTGFVKGKTGYSVNIGRIVDGVPVDGVIYFPATKELYFTGEDGKAYLQEGDKPWKKISASKAPLRDPLNVAVGFNEQITGYLGDRNINQVQLPAQMRTCKIATGECDISGINKGVGGVNTYDIAGPHAVLLAAGGDIVNSETGKPFRYDGQSIKVPSHIMGSKAALSLCIPGYELARGDIRK
jgi:3'(2'), 5'-bisphosphate nucleotidase